MSDIQPVTQESYEASLPPEATTPASQSSIIEAIAARSRQDAAAKVEGPKRGRGRPPGSKNKTTLEKEAASRGSGGGSRMVTPPPRVPRVKEDDELKIKELIERKKARALELEGKILTDLNDGIFQLFIMAGMPAEALFKDTTKVQAAVVNPNYTDLGNQMAISPMAAKSWARLAAELEQTGLGTKATAMAGTGNAGLIVASLMAAVTGAQYVKGITDVLGRVKQAQEAMARAQASNSDNFVAQDSPVNNTGGLI
jgi:hypothetical protein